MKVVPQSLLGRMVLTLAVLIIASQLLWFFIVRNLEREPRARQLAQQAAGVVQLTRTALIAVRPDKRRFFLSELDRQEGVRVYPAFPGEPAGVQPSGPFFPLLAKEIKKLLGEDTEVSFGRHGLAGLWVSFKIEDDEYWVALPRVVVQRPATLQWLIWGSLSLLITVLAAWAVVWRLNQPLSALARASRQVGQGVNTTPLTESGPAEIRGVTRSFNQMTHSLAQLQQERTIMLAGISHDLRTPLARMRLAVEMLGEKAGAQTQAGMVQDIEDMDAIIGQFLAYARGVDEAPREADLNAIVREVSARYARADQAIDLELAELPKLALSPLSIQRLLSNLIDNALRYAGASVSVRTAQVQNQVLLSVLDRGPGIATAQTELALQAFSRLDSARGGERGAGLGLAIVARIAQQHGGEVRLLARAGGGLEVQVSLPTQSGN